MQCPSALLLRACPCPMAMSDCILLTEPVLPLTCSHRTTRSTARSARRHRCMSTPPRRPPQPGHGQGGQGEAGCLGQGQGRCGGKGHRQGMQGKDPWSRCEGVVGAVEMTHGGIVCGLSGAYLACGCEGGVCHWFGFVEVFSRKVGRPVAKADFWQRCV